MPTPPREPILSPEKPRAEGEDSDHRYGHGCIVECLRCDGICCWQAEHDGDECNPETSNGGERLGGGAKIERSAFEVVWIDDAHGDGNAVGEVEADRGDRSCAVECDGRAKGREGKEEGTSGAEEDGTDWGMEATVNDVETVRDAAVTRKGEHHAGVGSLERISRALDSPNSNRK